MGGGRFRGRVEEVRLARWGRVGRGIVARWRVVVCERRI